MGKINCDVCGTAYPETASQCPICGCVRPADGAGTPDPADTPSRGGNYTYVKGGRFSKANVRKRNQGMPLQEAPQFQEPNTEEPQGEGDKTDKGLVVAVCVLLLAIIAVVIYIVTRFFAPGVSDEENGGLITLPSTGESTAVTTVPETTVETQEPTIVETTEPTVEETVEPTVETTTEGSVPTGNYYVEPYSLNTENRKNDVTIYRNNTFKLELRDATGELMDIEWTVEDPEICSVEGNNVTGLKVGKTTVKITINGTTYACIVRVKA